MTVAPRYAEYSDAHDTGVSVPVMVPPGCRNIQTQPDIGTFAPEPSAAGVSVLTAARPSSEGHGAESHTSHEEDSSWASLQDHLLSVAGAGSAAESSMPEAVQETGGQPAACEQHAQYFLCRKADVDHVFVDHPMYCRTTDIYGSSNVNTYQEAGDFPDLDIRYSILCQAALAAPLLLWGRSEQSPAVQGAPLETALDQSTLSGRHASEQAAQLQPDGCVATASAVMPKLCMSGPHETALPDLASAARTLEVCQPQVLSPQHAEHMRQTGSAANGGACSGTSTDTESGPRPLVFIGNDWPSAPLALRLKHCVQQAAAASSCQHVAGDAPYASRLIASLQHARSAFCIHNLAYQGTMPISTFPRLCLPDAALTALLWPPPASSSTGAPQSGSRASETDGEQRDDSDAGCSGAETNKHAATSVNWMHVRTWPPVC